jgi:hypothetical protein
MSTTAIATRLPDDVAQHVEEVAESPATEHTSKSAVVREIVTRQFD